MPRLTSLARQPVIGITLGDPAGIGPEVIKKALRDPHLPRGFTYQIIGAPPKKIHLGHSTRVTAQLAMNALEKAFTHWQRGDFAAIVTGPVQKETLAEVGFRYPGQTEFFAARCKKKSSDAVMVLTDPKLTVALCTTHCSLRDALRSITPAKVKHVAEQTALFLRKLGIPQPKIAVAGINPHAGEHGLFGGEEKRILRPAIAALQKKHLAVTGPYSPDTIFYTASQGKFDAVVCAYHDQGLIPFKLLAFTTGVNVTLGLPLIRTSPDHGTALEIAGKNRADHHSMLAAIQLACKLVKATRKA
jgi:4-hydroxythreonine-4-phosphate dehydrogenase